MSQTLVSHPDSSRDWLLGVDRAHGISETEAQSVGCSIFFLSINKCSISVRLDKCLLGITQAEVMVWHEGKDCRAFGELFRIIFCDSVSLFNMCLLIRFSAKL